MAIRSTKSGGDRGSHLYFMRDTLRISTLIVNYKCHIPHTRIGRSDAMAVKIVDERILGGVLDDNFDETDSRADFPKPREKNQN